MSISDRDFNPYLPPSGWSRSIIGTNVAGHAVKPMLAQGSGSIVSVVSGAHGDAVFMARLQGRDRLEAYTWSMELAGARARNGLSPVRRRLASARERRSTRSQPQARRAAAARGQLRWSNFG